MSGPPRCHLLALLAAAALSACTNPDTAVGFHEDNPAARLRAIRQAAARDDPSAIPDLIDLLESDDPAERLLSIRALERITGQTLGYDHAAPLEDRREAVRRWSAWYAQQPKAPLNPPASPARAAAR
jgi:HEAT repeat protein